ncbi:MAG: fatty acyl-AMP ligase [Oligoflexia bacterium]|nr:fatty acyl-AMP ligase [Oligoflexia bacterium]
MLLSGSPLPPLRFDTLSAALWHLEGRPGPWLTVVRGRDERTMTGAQVLDLARRWRTAAQDAGLKPGDRAIVLMPNTDSFVGAFMGAVLAGAAAVPLAYPGSLSNRADAVARVQPLVETAKPSVVLTTPDLAEGWSVPVVTAPAPEAVGSDAVVSPDDLAFLQFTSGSMGRPKGAAITHRAVMTCVTSMGTALSMSGDDVGVSWLPLYHDMGLVGGLLCPVVFGFPLHLMRPGDFILHPARWLQRAAAVGVTVAAAPDFAWRLAARRHRKPPGDLSTWRIALDGAEPVHRSTLDAFSSTFGPFGFPSTALRPSYGLAENTLGVCIHDPDSPAADLVWDGRALPSVGAPLPGVKVRIMAEGRLVGEDEQGEIQVQSGSLMQGYFQNAAATSAVLRQGWLCTGDLGVISGGQLFVTGRIKDLVIQNGVKFHPYDIERVAADAAQATPNGATAFARPSGSGEELVVVVEVPARRRQGVERRVKGALVENLGVRVDQILVVAPGALPRTTSGKIRRPAAIAMFRDATAGAPNA